MFHHFFLLAAEPQFCIQLIYRIISKIHRQLVFFLSFCLLWNPSFVYSWFIESSLKPKDCLFSGSLCLLWNPSFVYSWLISFPQPADSLFSFPLSLLAGEPQFCIQSVYRAFSTEGLTFFSLSDCCKPQFSIQLVHIAIYHFQNPDSLFSSSLSDCFKTPVLYVYGLQTYCIQNWG